MKNDIARVDGVLAVSRAIGDMQQKQNLIPESETYNQMMTCLSCHQMASISCTARKKFLKWFTS
jgi:hypothetical protein